MCIIAYAPKGAQIKEETIKIMFQGNPDGAGIMWKPTDNSKVEIRKGFMKVDDLIKAYSEIPVECEKAIHCRIATSGKISTACCHPFPVRAKTSAMKQAKDTASIALMHNGMINYCTPRQGMKAAYSDTMLFAAKYLYPAQKLLDSEWLTTLIEESTTSRLLIMREFGETIMLGSWQFSDGVYYSNGNYKATPAYNYSNNKWHCDTLSIQEPIWECIAVNIGNTKPEEAKEEAIQALATNSYVQDYEVYISSYYEKELYIEVIGLPQNVKDIAGFRIIERYSCNY